MIITTLNAFRDATNSVPADAVIAADVETYGTDPRQGHLLGVSLCWEGSTGIYVPITTYQRDTNTFQKTVAIELLSVLSIFIEGHSLLGWNMEFDRQWLDSGFGITTTWKADVRCMWYLTDQEQVERGYGLKSAQRKLLGWAQSNDTELETWVSRMGGKLSEGDHYLAPLHALAKYACLDTYSTLLCYQKLVPLFEKLEYWEYLTWLQDYGKFLTEVTREGVAVDHTKLTRARKVYSAKLETLSVEIRHICRSEIEAIERRWHQAKVSGYKLDHAREAYLNQPERQRRFNLRSADQRIELFHSYLGFPVAERTETGKPKSDRATYERIDHPAAKVLVQSSETAKLLDFTEGYLESIQRGRVHFPHNWCATVTGRLGGFKPYDLNMPFSEEALMSAFYIEPGWDGLHMDFKALEPTLIAAYSGDPTLTKLYRDGIGDVYLELGVEIFPRDEAHLYSAHHAKLIQTLHDTYNPTIKTSSEVKAGVKELRDAVKIIQLAVGYTGTKVTVAKNLTLAGFPTSEERAALYVNRYWSKYIAVRQLAEKLQALYDRQGYIRSVGGAYIWCPKKFRKDLMNRFVQRSGHEILVCFVKELYRLAAERGLPLRAVLPDIHDSHSAKIPTGLVEEAKQAFEDALATINKALGFSVQFGMELKTFRTFYGLKNNETKY